MLHTPLAMKTKSPFVTLASLGRMPVVIGSIGMKKIIRVATARQHKWYLVLPAVGDKDCRCLLVRAFDRKYMTTPLKHLDIMVLSSETDRLVARDDAR